MQTKMINPANNWDFWDASAKEELKNATNNFQVGQQLAFENEEFLVWTIHLSPGERLPFHKHNKPYIWSALSKGNARSYYDDGKVTEVIYEIGDTMYYEDLHENNSFIHDLKNIGNTTLIFSTIEFKTK